MLSFDPVTYESGHNSAGMAARVHREFADGRASVTAGADVDYSPGFREEYQINATRDGNIFTSYTRGNLIYDYDVTFIGTSPYVQLEAHPLSRLRLDAGLRYDHITYDYDNKLEPLVTGSHRRPADAPARVRHPDR